MNPNTGDYYYGQGKVFLARRLANGRTGAMRWVGDVSALNVNFTFEQQATKVSRGGVLLPAQLYKTAQSASISSTWHYFSAENLALVLGAVPVVEPFSIKAEDELPAGISQGDIYSLPHTAVFNVEVEDLKNDVDYIVDRQWGTIEFLVTPANKPFLVKYEHLQNQSLPLFTSTPVELSLRYQGVNIAQDNAPTLVELYRLVLEPLATLELINTSNSMPGMEMAAQLLADLSRKNVSEFGHFGRIQLVNRQTALTYNGKAAHNGQHKYRG
ncbi:phage tail tube protein [Serratia fonticola]